MGLSAIRGKIAEIDSNLPVTGIAGWDSIVAASVAQRDRVVGASAPRSRSLAPNLRVPLRFFGLPDSERARPTSGHSPHEPSLCYA